jgi:hypothetical protein
MGDAIEDACAVVRDYEVGDPGLFFRTVEEVYEQLGADADFSGFKDKFVAQANMEGFGTAGEQLAAKAEGDGWRDFIKALVDEGSRSLASRCDDSLDGVAGMFDDAEAGAEAKDQERWETAVTKYGPAWAAWDGSESGWVEYRDWFYEATSADDERAYAAAYEKLEPLNTVETAERIAQLKEFGFTIETDTLESLAGLFDEEAIAAANENAQQAVQEMVGTGDIPPDVGTRIADAFGEVLTEVEGASDMALEDIRELFKEIADEVQAEGAQS